MTVRPRPARDDFTSRLRSPAVDGAGRPLARDLLRRRLRHRPDQPLRASYPTRPVPFPTRPVWGYRVTQGLHVIAGTAAVPLLLVKLWTVFPKLFARPPGRRDLATLRALARRRAALDRACWSRPRSSSWPPACRTRRSGTRGPSSFRATHYAVAWVAIGALVLHVAVKLPVIRGALGSDLEDDALDRPGTAATTRGLLARGPAAHDLARRRCRGPGDGREHRAVAAQVSVFGVRSGDGPQGVPINKSAEAAGVVAPALEPGVPADGRRTATARGRADAATSWAPCRSDRGPADRLRRGLERERRPGPGSGSATCSTWSEPRAASDVRVESLQPRGAFRVTTLPANFADDPLTLLALELDGEPLAIDHGFPCRLIAPNRPGVLQTKWVARLEVLA